VYSFGSSGFIPVASLIVGPDGNLYGVTEVGGTNDAGVFYRFAQDGSFTVLYNFCSNCADGGSPIAPLTLGSDGNFYGVTGGITSYPCNCEGPFSIFRLSLDGDFTLLAALSASQGAAQGLLQASDGYFYFYSPLSGAAECSAGFDTVGACGTIARMDSSGAISTVANLGDTGGQLTAISNAILVEDSQGILWGTTPTGPTTCDEVDCYTEVGSDFSLNATAATFTNIPNTESPAGLFLASDGNFYGQDSNYNYGTFYQLTPSGQLNYLYTPEGDENGGGATLGTPIQAADGSFYDSTLELPNNGYCGGPDDQINCGALFRVVMNPALAGPVQLSFNTNDIPVGSASPLTWAVSNAFSTTMQQCYLYATVNGVLSSVGKLTGSLTGRVFGGTAQVTPAAAGVYTYAITCGGIESNTKIVRVGSARAQSAVALATNSPVALGSTLTLTATPSTTQYVAALTGSVAFSTGGTPLGSVPLANGSATLSVAAQGIPAGTYPITATYSGDTNYLISSVTTDIVVQGYVTSATLAATPNPVRQGQSVTLSSAVARTGVSGTPTGSVSFYAGTQLLDTAKLMNGVAALTAPVNGSIAAGTYAVTAKYSGDSSDQTATSPAVSITVLAPTTTTLQASPNPAPADHTVTLTATVKETYGSSVPTGTVTLAVGSTSFGSIALNTAGQAILNASDFGYPAGTYAVRASYSGDSLNLASSATLNVVVQ
jgi:uncharacterized repeat protein (TIGR03803 family)